jgi:hypothetical protein
MPEGLSLKDPVGFDGGDINLFVYVANNPTGDSDPLGLQGGRAGATGRGNYKPDFKTRCNLTQDCDTLSRNMAALARQLASAQLIDEELGFGRHSPPISTTIPDLQRAFGRCKRIFDSKCKCDPPKSPNPAGEPSRARRRLQPSRDELRMREMSAREMEIFWQKVLYGSIAGGAVVVAGPPAIVAILRWLAVAGAASAPAYAP